MNIISNVDNRKFTLNGIQYFKNYISNVAGSNIRIINAYDSNDVLLDWVDYAQITLNGVVYGSVALLQQNLIDVCFNRAIGFDPATTDLSEFLNNSPDPYVKVSELPPAVTIDAVPTDGSNNAVSSNGVFDALPKIFSNTTEFVHNIGNSNRLLVATLTIPANTIQNGDIWELKYVVNTPSVKSGGTVATFNQDLSSTNKFLVNVPNGLSVNASFLIRKHLKFAGGNCRVANASNQLLDHVNAPPFNQVPIPIVYSNINTIDIYLNRLDTATDPFVFHWATFKKIN